MELSETEKSYLAGLFDGEGSIGINYTNGGQPAVKVEIGMTCKKVIEWVQEKLGGLYCEVAAGKYNPKHKARYTLQWNGHKSRGLLEAIFPFLIVKRQHASLALAFLDVREDLGNKRLTDTETLKRLKIELEALSVS